MSGIPPATSRSRPEARWFAIVFAVALGLRSVELFELSDTPLLGFVLGDAKNYVAWGREIASGNWIGHETFYQAPLYPYFLGSIFSLFGDDLFRVRVIQLFVGSASCGLLVLAGWRWFGKRAGIAAGFVLALYGPALYADAMLQKSVLDLFFMCLALWLLSAVSTRASARSALGLGAAVGFMALTRENALVFPFVLAPWLALAPECPRARRVALAGLFLAGMGLVLAPVALRNYAVGGEFHLTTSQFGHNFYIGNNPAADGTYKPLIEGRGDPRIERLDAIELAERAEGRTLTPSEVSDFYTRRALDYIRAEPLAWSALMLRKLMLVFTSVEVVDTEDQYTHAESSRVLALCGALFHFGVLAPIAALGVVLTGWRRREAIVLYGMFAIYTATLVVFYLFARYRLPLVPISALFAGVALAQARRFASERPRPHFFQGIAAMSLVAVFCNWPLMDERYMRSVTHYNLGNELAAVGRTEEAMAQFRTAISLYSRNAFAIHNLGALLANRDDLAGAEVQYRRALKINPDYVQAHFNLARTLRDTGRSDEAVSHFVRGLELAPHDPEVQNELGELYAARGEWAAARARFEAALRDRPDFAAARGNLERAAGK